MLGSPKSSKMRCSQFLTLYSDFRDGCIRDPRLKRRVNHHVRSCQRCARYHRAVSEGVQLLRSLADPEPSEAFRPGLRKRLLEEARTDQPLTAPPPRFAATLMLAAAVALFTGEGSAPSPDDRDQPTTQPPRPMPMVTANPGPPFVSFAELSLPPIRTSPVQPPPPPAVEPRDLEVRRSPLEPVTLASWATAPR